MTSVASSTNSNYNYYSLYSDNIKSKKLDDIPQAEVDKFIHMLDEGWKTGTGIFLGQAHDEIGTYKLLNHPTVRNFLISKSEEAKKEGYTFLSHYYLELDPEATSMKTDGTTGTISSILSDFNKSDSAKNNNARENLKYDMSTYTTSSKELDNEKMKFYEFLHSIGTQLVAVDSDQNISVLDGPINKRRSEETNLRNQTIAKNINESQKDNYIKSKFLTENGNIHLLSKENNNLSKEEAIYLNDYIQPSEHSLEYYANQMHQSTSYATSIALIPEIITEPDVDLKNLAIMEYKLLKNTIQVDNYSTAIPENYIEYKSIRAFVDKYRSAANKAKGDAKKEAQLYQAIGQDISTSPAGIALNEALLNKLKSASPNEAGKIPRENIIYFNLNIIMQSLNDKNIFNTSEFDEYVEYYKYLLTKDIPQMNLSEPK